MIKMTEQRSFKLWLNLTMPYRSASQILLLATAESSFQNSWQVNPGVVLHPKRSSAIVISHLMSTRCPGGCFTIVSELSKIFTWNLCIAEILLLMQISSWNFVRVPKAMLETLTINVISGIVYFYEIILESLRSISETTPCYITFHGTVFWWFWHCWKFFKGQLMPGKLDVTDICLNTQHVFVSLVKSEKYVSNI